MKKINFVITDLDDTIWDWLTMWYESFDPYFKRISNEFDIDKENLLKSFRKIHQKYKTTESSCFYHDLDCLSETQKNKFTVSSGEEKSIIYEYNSNKKNNLYLYKSVLETLIEIKKKGSLIVGFTESHSFYTKYRIKHLNLDGIIDVIYAPIDLGFPDTETRYYHEDFWEPKITEIRYLPRSTKKPSSEILEIILQDFCVKKEYAIYIGDKLDRDILMAQDAGVTSVYAEYGHKIDNDQYQLLREVTHWSNEEVQREINSKTRNNDKPIIPDITLSEKFNEILNYFVFSQFEKKPTVKDVQCIITIWEKVIDVQKHFNLLELQIRNYALTVFTFIIGGTGLLFKEGVVLNIFGITMPAASIFPILGIIVIFAFYFMDRHWYHRLLIGTVKQSSFIENRWSRYYPELSLSNAISKESPMKICKKEFHSNDKFCFFYLPLFFSLILLAFVSFFQKSQSHENKAAVNVEPQKKQTIILQAQGNTGSSSGVNKIPAHPSKAELLPIKESTK